VAVRDAKTFLLADDKTSPIKLGFAQFTEIRETLQVLSLDIASEKIVTLAVNSCFPSASAATNADYGEPVQGTWNAVAATRRLDTPDKNSLSPR
jgi:hypothetical protein